MRLVVSMYWDARKFSGFRASGKASANVARRSAIPVRRATMCSEARRYRPGAGSWSVPMRQSHPAGRRTEPVALERTLFSEMLHTGDASGVKCLASNSRTTTPYHSLRSGTGRKRPSDPMSDAVWGEGTALLGEAKDARSFLGKLCKEYGQRLVLQAISDAQSAIPAEPRAWLVARCQERRAISGNRQVALEERNAAIAANWHPPEDE